MLDRARSSLLSLLKKNDIKQKTWISTVSTIVPYVKKQQGYNTSDIFKANELTIEFTNEGFEYFRENLFNLSFNTQSNPSPDGRAVVKIPKENTFIFATPLRNAEYLVAQAVEYDTVQITIDENLSMRIKDFLVNIKTDYAYLNTGIQENQGINIERTELFTGLVEKIRLESSQGNHFIELYNKNIVIDAKTGKVLNPITKDAPYLHPTFPVTFGDKVEHRPFPNRQQRRGMIFENNRNKVTTLTEVGEVCLDAVANKMVDFFDSERHEKQFNSAPVRIGNRLFVKKHFPKKFFY